MVMAMTKAVGTVALAALVLHGCYGGLRRDAHTLSPSKPLHRTVQTDCTYPVSLGHVVVPSSCPVVAALPLLRDIYDTSRLTELLPLG